MCGLKTCMGKYVCTFGREANNTFNLIHSCDILM